MAPASTSGRLYQITSFTSALGVKLYTSPLSSVSSLGLVNRETPIVTPKHTAQAIKARHILDPSELPKEKTWRNCSITHSAIDTRVPSARPTKPPQGVVRFQNMPRRKVASRGALKIENS